VLPDFRKYINLFKIPKVSPHYPSVENGFEAEAEYEALKFI